jgi:hypothetical protein
MNPLTFWDVFKIVGFMNGAFTTIVMGMLFYWMRHIKTDVKQIQDNATKNMDKRYDEVIKDIDRRYSGFKSDIRTMIRDMNESFEKRYIDKFASMYEQIAQNKACIDHLKERYIEHYDRYHSKKE